MTDHTAAMSHGLFWSVRLASSAAAARIGLRPEAAGTATPGRAMERGPAFGLIRVAVEVGFEPTEACTSHAFEACALGH